jgi:hypothetical protein
MIVRRPGLCSVLFLPGHCANKKLISLFTRIAGILAMPEIDIPTNVSNCANSHFQIKTKVASLRMYTHFPLPNLFQDD